MRWVLTITSAFATFSVGWVGWGGLKSWDQADTAPVLVGVKVGAELGKILNHVSGRTPLPPFLHL